MHLLCRNQECVGNDLPAGSVEDERCAYCREPLADAEGNVLVRGAGALVDGEPPEDFNRLMDALREAGHTVEVVQLSAVRHGDKLLVSALKDDGQLAAAEVCDGERAAEVEHVISLLNDD